MTNREAMMKAAELDKEAWDWCDGGWEVFAPLYTEVRLRKLIEANPEAADMEYIPEPGDMIEY